MIVKMKKILLMGGYSSTNIGNAFYEKGVRYMFSHISDDIVLYNASNLSLYYWGNYRREKEGFEPIEHIKDFDYIVWMGPIFDASEMKQWKHVLEKAKKYNIKIVCMGAGSFCYSKSEVKEVRNILSNYPFHILMSRDSWTYNAYKEYFSYAYDGVCPAFYSQYYFKKWKIDYSPYVVFDFETYTEPVFMESENGFEFNGRNWRILKPIKKLNFLNAVTSEYFENTLGGVSIVRTKNTCIRPLKIGGKHFGNNIYISDVPEDYLNIYANAEAVFSDRVHSCVGALALGKQTMFLGKTQRARLFKKVLGDEADNLSTKLVQLDMDLLRTKLNNQMEFLENAIG